VSFVDESFNLQTYDLCVQEYDAASKHAPCIRQDLMSKLKVYVDPAVLEREVKFVFVSDSDPKLVAALRDDFDRQSCAVHDVSLCVKFALKAAESNAVGVLIEDCKVLVRYFKKTGLNNKLSTTLKQEVSTRFNSVYTMLKSVDDVFDEVTNELTSSDNIAYLANIRRKTLKILCKELKRFDDATKKLAVEKIESLHMVIPVLHELKTTMAKQAVKYVQEDKDVSRLCNDLAKAVQDKCLAKLTWYHIAAAFLYPEYRNHPGVVQMEAEVNRVRLDLRGMLVQLVNDRQTPVQSPPRKKPKMVLINSESESDDEEQQAIGSGLETTGNVKTNFGACTVLDVLQCVTE
jgi:hypothetical protein